MIKMNRIIKDIKAVDMSTISTIVMEDMEVEVDSMGIMEIDRYVTFYFTDCTPRCFVIFHVIREIFRCVFSMFLAEVAEALCLNKLNILLTYV